MKKVLCLFIFALVLFSACGKNKEERMYCECSKRKQATVIKSVEVVNAKPEDHQSACEDLENGNYQESGISYTLINCHAITD